MNFYYYLLEMTIFCRKGIQLKITFWMYLRVEITINCYSFLDAQSWMKMRVVLHGSVCDVCRLIHSLNHYSISIECTTTYTLSAPTDNMLITMKSYYGETYFLFQKYINRKKHTAFYTSLINVLSFKLIFKIHNGDFHTELGLSPMLNSVDQFTTQRLNS